METCKTDVHLVTLVTLMPCEGFIITEVNIILFFHFFLEMGEATAEPALSLLAQTDLKLVKLAQESGMNVWLQVQQGLEKDGISGLITDDHACDILIGGINLLKMANVLAN